MRGLTTVSSSLGGRCSYVAQWFDGRVWSDRGVGWGMAGILCV